MRLAGARRSFSSSPELPTSPSPRRQALLLELVPFRFRPDRTATTHVPWPQLPPPSTCHARGLWRLQRGARLTWQLCTRGRREPREVRDVCSCMACNDVL